MKLEEALEYTDKKLDEGHKSDGCTLAPDMGIKKFCRMHDMLRRFAPVSAARADNLLFQGIMTKGWHYLPVASVYWIAVRAQSAFNLDPMAMAGFGGIILVAGLLAYFG